MINIFDKVFYIIKNNTKIKTQKDLAVALGITQPCISDARKRNVFPSDWLVKISLIYGMTFNSILGLESKDALCVDEKILELSDLAEKSFDLLSQFNKIKVENVALSSQVVGLENRLKALEEIISTEFTKLSEGLDT